MIMKKILFTLALLWSVAYGQFCADEDTVRSNSATQITATTARINGTTSHFTGSVVSLQLKYVRVGQTDTVTSSGTGALRNLTGLQPATQYVYYYKSICGSGSQSQTIGPYRFTTLANTILYVDERPTRFYHWKADSSMIVPQGDTVVGREPSTFPQIRYKTSDNTFYGYYPSCSCWRALAIDSSGIIGLLDGKVDSVTVNGDSLFYWKVGVSYGYILPSLNNVWRNTGNSGIDTSVNWLGTNDNKDLVIKTNNSRRVTVNVNGAIGIGDPPDYGTSGYRLQTNGSGSPVSWVDNTLSSLTAASASNTINNANNKQTWQWNSLSATGLLLSTTSTAAAANAQTILEITSSGANSNATQSTYGIRSTNTHTGTTSSNYGGYFSAGGASLNNIGAYGIATGSNGYGVYGNTNSGKGVYGNATGGYAFYGVSSGSTGSVTAAHIEATGATTTNIAMRLKAANAVNNIALAVENGEGSVGIGTLTPAAVFHTVGTVRMASMGTASSDTTTYKAVGINSLGDLIPMTYWPGSGGGSSQWTTSGSDIYYNTGNVGIGTSSPATKIHATASGAVAKFVSSGYVQNTVEISDPDGYTYITNGQFKVGSVPFVINANGSYITYQTGGVDRMRVTYAGDVGIGNTSPGEKLEVTGNIKASGKLIARNIIYRTLNASDADFTAAVGTAYVLPDAATTVRTVTLPAGQDGDIIRFHLPLTPSNHWTFSTAVTLPDGSTYTNIDTYTNSVTTIQYDGANSVWRAVVNL